MKKLSILAAMFMLLSLVALTACGGNNEPNVDPTPNVNAISGRPHEIVESNHYILMGNVQWRMYYGVTLYNPNTDEAILAPRVRVTGFNAEGEVIGTSTSALAGKLLPGETMADWSFAFRFEDDGSYPELPYARVEFEVVEPLEHEFVETDDTPLTFDVAGTAASGRNLTGYFVNNTDEDFSNFTVVAIYRDDNGRLFGGVKSVIEDVLPANGRLAFELSTRRRWVTDNYEFFFTVAPGGAAPVVNAPPASNDDVSPAEPTDTVDEPATNNNAPAANNQPAVNQGGCRCGTCGLDDE